MNGGRDYAALIEAAVVAQQQSTLSLVGERNLVAGNSSGEEFFLANLVGEDLAGEI